MILRTTLIVFALLAGLSGVSAAPLENTALSSNDEFRNSQNGGKIYWDKQMKERD